MWAVNLDLLLAVFRGVHFGSCITSYCRVELSKKLLKQNGMPFEDFLNTRLLSKVFRKGLFLCLSGNSILLYNLYWRLHLLSVNQRLATIFDRVASSGRPVTQMVYSFWFCSGL